MELLTLRLRLHSIRGLEYLPEDRSNACVMCYLHDDRQSLRMLSLIVIESSNWVDFLRTSPPDAPPQDLVMQATKAMAAQPWMTCS